MSYILDALKKADAERGQSAAPQSLGVKALPIAPARNRMPSARAGLMGGVALALIAAVVWAWFALRPLANDGTTLAAEAPARAETSTAVEPPPSVVLAPKAPAIEQAAPTAPPVKKAAAAPVLPILAKAPPPPPASKPSATAAVAAATTPSPAATKKPTSATTALSAAQRAALPPIAVSGSSYSANPAHRMLIANGQVVKEGQELSPGLSLEAIGPHSAVFNQRGTRFNVNY